MRIVFSLFVVLVVLCSCYGQIETGIISENSSITPQESPIFNAAREGLTERVMEIIRSGRDVNEANHDGWTALLFAVEAKKLHTIKSLLKNGADPNLRDRDGWSPLMFAAHAGNMAMVRILLDANANPLLANNRGFAAHSIAQFEGYKEVSKLIAERGVVAAMLTEDFVAMMVMLRDGASVNTQSSAGWTPLIAATASGNIDIVRELLEFPDILINQAENDGWTPLLFAANNNRVEITSILLEYGADSTIKSKVGFTAQGIARDRNFPDVVKVLKSATVLRNEYLKKVYEKQQQSVADFTGGMGGEVDIELETGKSSTLEGKTEIKVLPKVTPQQQQSVEVNNKKKKTGWLW